MWYYSVRYLASVFTCAPPLFSELIIIQNQFAHCLALVQLLFSLNTYNIKIIGIQMQDLECPCSVAKVHSKLIECNKVHVKYCELLHSSVMLDVLGGDYDVYDSKANIGI